MSTRSYGQYCGLARALDVVGSRWSRLIVRELLVGPARYGQLQAGLPVNWKRPVWSNADSTPTATASSTR